jgi:hypothetical protein
MRRFLLLAPLALAACQRSAPPPAPAQSEAAPVTSEAVPAALPAEPPTATATPSPATIATATTPPLDAAALREHKDPDRLLAYLSEAIDAGKWGAAAKAWQDGTDGAGVKKLFGSPAAALVTFGKGEEEGAAGSLYYAAPILLLTHGGQARREGTITLRRVNDVPGASAASLAWHVERVEWKD